MPAGPKYERICRIGGQRDLFAGRVDALQPLGKLGNDQIDFPIACLQGSKVVF